MGHAAQVYDLVWEYMESRDWVRFLDLFVAEPELKFQDRKISAWWAMLDFGSHVRKMDVDGQIRPLAA